MSLIIISGAPVTSALTEVSVDVPLFVTSSLIVLLASFSTVRNDGAFRSIFLIVDPPPPEDPPPLEVVVVVGHTKSLPEQSWSMPSPHISAAPGFSAELLSLQSLPPQYNAGYPSLSASVHCS